LKKTAKKTAKLSPEAQAWFDRLRSEYGIEDSAGLLLLQSAMEAFDRLQECSASIAAHGASCPDRFGQLKAHPLLGPERDARAAMLSALKSLNLDLEPLRDGPGRPAGG